MAPNKKRGFSLLELMIVVAISLTLAAIIDVSLQPALRQMHVDQAYSTTLNSLRRAHDQAVADMRIYVVTFTGPTVVAPIVGGTITVQQNVGAPGVFPPTLGPNLFQVTLPADVTFHVEPGVPTSPVTVPTTPDGFGGAAFPNGFDFNWGPAGSAGGGTTIFFYPDGTAQDGNGNINNGVVYMGIPGQLPTCRAVTLWGFTSRIRGWQLYKSGGAWTWSQK